MAIYWSIDSMIADDFNRWSTIVTSSIAVTISLSIDSAMGIYRNVDSREVTESQRLPSTGPAHSSRVFCYGRCCASSLSLKGYSHENERPRCDVCGGSLPLSSTHWWGLQHRPACPPSTLSRSLHSERASVNHIVSTTYHNWQKKNYENSKRNGFITNATSVTKTDATVSLTDGGHFE